MCLTGCGEGCRAALCLCSRGEEDLLCRLAALVLPVPLPSAEHPLWCTAPLRWAPGPFPSPLWPSLYRLSPKPLHLIQSLLNLIL